MDDNTNNKEYGALRSTKQFNVYMVPTSISRNTIIEKTSYYPYIASNIPASETNEKGEDINASYSVLSFDVMFNDNLTEKDKKKIAIYAEFQKEISNKYVFGVDTVTGNLWPMPTPSEDSGSSEESGSSETSDDDIKSLVTGMREPVEDHPNGDILLFTFQNLLVRK